MSSRVYLLANSLPNIPVQAWHLKVAVFGSDISYDGDDGITRTNSSNGQQYEERLFMGVTLRTRQQFLHFLDRLENSWNAQNYNSVSHNCLHFVDKILDFLGAEAVPGRFRVAHTAVAAVADVAEIGGIIIGVAALLSWLLR